MHHIRPTDVERSIRIRETHGLPNIHCLDIRLHVSFTTIGIPFIQGYSVEGQCGALHEDDGILLQRDTGHSVRTHRMHRMASNTSVHLHPVLENRPLRGRSNSVAHENRLRATTHTRSVYCLTPGGLDCGDKGPTCGGTDNTPVRMQDTPTTHLGSSRHPNAQNRSGRRATT